METEWNVKGHTLVLATHFFFDDGAIGLVPSDNGTSSEASPARPRFIEFFVVQGDIKQGAKPQARERQQTRAQGEREGITYHKATGPSFNQTTETLRNEGEESTCMEYIHRTEVNRQAIQACN